MTFLPIVQRELRIASRRSSTYWLRSLLALGVALIWFALLAVGNNGIPRNEIGKVLFIAIGILALSFCLLSGLFLTSDCLSHERREGTLGLLFLTDLRGYDVVCGKLMATSLPAFYGLLTILPVLALPLLMGGVSVGEFWRVALALVCTLAFSLCVGLLISAFCHETRQAMSTTLFTLTMATGVLPLVYFACDWLSRTTTWHGKLSHPVALLWPSPAYLYSRAFDSYFARRPGHIEFFTSFATLAALAFAALFIASLYLPRIWREGAESTSAGDRRTSRQLWRYGGAGFRVLRRCFLEENPIYWLSSRDRWPGVVACATLGSLFTLWLVFMAGTFSSRRAGNAFFFSMSLIVAFACHLAVKWQVAVEASRRFSEDRQSGALELLLVSPLSIERLLEGQRRALLGTFVAPLVLALLSNAGFFWWLVLVNPMHMGGDEGSVFCEAILGGAVLLLADYYALSWVGMLMGYRKRRHHIAIGFTLARILVPPWLGIFLLWFLGASGALNGSGAVMLFMILWHGAGFMLDMISAIWAREELLRTLRENPYSEIKPEVLPRNPLSNIARA
jgi:ABC-type transport system involved in cytochrome c biogenesis permease component